MKTILLSSLFSLILFLNISAKSWNDCCMISPIKNNNICYFFIAKNGSMSLRKLLQADQIIDFDEIKSSLNQYISVLAVRNPLYRPIAIYNEVLKLREKNTTAKETLQMEFYKNRNNVEYSFSLFLDEIKDNFYEPHICHQCDALLKKNLTLNDINFIILFENLNEDYKFFCEKYNFPYIQLPKQNETPFALKDRLIRFIDSNPEIQKKIHDIWKEDFKFYEEAKKYRERIITEASLNEFDAF